MSDTTSVAPDGYPELLADLADQVSIKLVEHHIEINRAADIGLAVAEFVRTHWGGQPIYIPSGAPNLISDRYVQIFEKCNGRNHRQLAREYGISVVRVYQIVKQVTQEMMAKRQGGLF